ncbi:hypothetical protein M9Y10_004937 [Tritrichomonas musculus]|uniref:Uncharacterized protein n=1 Tax=Tritrichomonas musculus TaxID=1915356 RepID=A0ABR2JJW3_9EUKA
MNQIALHSLLFIGKEAQGMLEVASSECAFRAKKASVAFKTESGRAAPKCLNFIV